jgi:hypothetical protein
MKEKRMSDVILRPFRVVFRVHALRQMFNRRIEDEDVQVVVRTGKIIEEYPDDTPYPSYLLKATVRKRPLHVVVAYNKWEDVVIVITAYEPDPNIWDNNYSRRKS